MNYSFESFEHIIDSGILATDAGGKPDLYLIPRKGSEGSPFLNSYKLIILEKNVNRLPKKLEFITPFLTVQHSISKTSKEEVTEKLDLKLWQAIWDHVSVLYTYSAYIAVKDPWEHALKISDDFDAFEDFDLKSFYDDFEISSNSPFEYYLLTHFQFPNEYVQKALASKAIATHFNSEILRLFEEYDKAGNPVDRDIFEKVSKWAPHIASSGVNEFIEKATGNWISTLGEIDSTRAVLIMLLYSLEMFYSRLSLDDLLRQSSQFTNILLANKKKIKKHSRLTVAQYFLYGRMLHAEGLRNKIHFFPDYLKLVRTTAILYDYVKSSNLTTRWHDKGRVKLNTDYMQIGVDDKNKPDKYSLIVNVDNLNQLTHVPPYLFFQQLRSLILCSAELMNFTEQHLGLDPAVLYQELKEAKQNQHYDLKGTFILKDLISRMEEQVKNRLLLGRMNS